MKENNLKQLNDLFPNKDLEWRIQSSGTSNGKTWAIALVYVTNRAIQNRLDAVVGKANWKNEYIGGPDGGILCGLSIKYEGEWITKWDGAENTDIDAVKGGLSGSMKRAAVQWGIGRYLYKLEADFATCSATHGRFRGRHKDGNGQWHKFQWDPPELPEWALPKGDKPEPLPSFSDPAEETLGTEEDQLKALEKTGMIKKGAVDFTKTKAYKDVKAILMAMADTNKNHLDDGTVAFLEQIDVYISNKVQSGSTWKVEMDIVQKKLTDKVAEILKEIY